MALRRFAPGARVGVVFVGVAAAASILCAPAALGQGRMGGRHSADSKRDADANPDFKPLPSQDSLTPHAGEYVSTETNYYEIVYMPLQTRIYLFDSKLRPLTARDVHARMILQLPRENAPRRVPFQYAAMPPGAIEQDYVAALFDIRPLQGKETSVTLEFSGLSDRRNPTASFAPYYPRFTIRPYVAKALVTEADRDGIARQRVCPVTGAPLGSRGPVVKLYIADYPLYVSGDDCIAAVQEAPQRFLPPPTPSPVVETPARN